MNDCPFFWVGFLNPFALGQSDVIMLFLFVSGILEMCNCPFQGHSEPPPPPPPRDPTKTHVQKIDFDTEWLFQVPILDKNKKIELLKILEFSNKSKFLKSGIFWQTLMPG